MRSRNPQLIAAAPKPALVSVHAKALPATASEKQRQQAIVDLFRACGYFVMETGHIMHRVQCAKCSRRTGRKVLALCPECHETVWPSGWGNDAGVPDVLLTHGAWGKCVWSVIETKKPKGTRRKEQKNLVEMGFSVFAETDIEAARAIIAVERAMKIEPNKLLLGFLRQYDREPLRETA
jgi:hypothetical protein